MEVNEVNAETAVARVEHNSPPRLRMDTIERMGRAIASSQLFGIKTPEQAVALMLVAQAEGRHPASAAQDYNIIQGRPALKADTILARFQQAGGVVQWEELSDTRVAAYFSHPKSSPKPVLIDWTMERAAQAQLSGKENYHKYPRQMLRARVISEGVRTVYPASCSGMYTPEEVQDFGPTEPQAPAPQPEVSPLAQCLADKFNGTVQGETATPPASGSPAEPPAAPRCPKCGGEMWNNTDKRKAAQVEGKPNPPPAFACKAGKWDKVLKRRTGCDGVIWPAHGEEDPQRAAPPAIPGDPIGGAMAASTDADVPIETGQKIRIDRLIEDHEIIFDRGEKEQMIQALGCVSGCVDDMTKTQAQAFIKQLREIAERAQ